MGLSAGGHSDDQHVKGCVHYSFLVIPFGQYSTPWSLFSTTLTIPSANTKTWQDRSVAFFYLQKDPGLRSDKSSPASTDDLVVDGSEVHDEGKFVRVKLPARHVRGPEKSSRLVIHVALCETFAVYVVGLSLHGDVHIRQTREWEVFAVFRVTFCK